MTTLPSWKCGCCRHGETNRERHTVPSAPVAHDGEPRNRRERRAQRARERRAKLLGIGYEDGEIFRVSPAGNR